MRRQLALTATIEAVFRQFPPYLSRRGIQDITRLCSSILRSCATLNPGKHLWNQIFPFRTLILKLQLRERKSASISRPTQGWMQCNTCRRSSREFHTGVTTQTFSAKIVMYKDQGSKKKHGSRLQRERERGGQLTGKKGQSVLVGREGAFIGLKAGVKE